MPNRLFLVMKPKITIDDKGREVHLMAMEKLQGLALIFFVPIVLIFGVPYYLIWGENALTALRFRSFLFLVLFIVGGVVLHELLHGIVWAVFAKRGFRSIRFGIKWEYFTPYCHCLEPLKVWQYISGALAPVFFMGLLPASVALIVGNTLLMFFGIFYIWTAAGDLLAVWMVRKFRAKQWIYDHPRELGFIICDEVDRDEVL